MNDPIIHRVKRTVIFEFESYNPLPEIGEIESPIESPIESLF